MTTFKKGDRVRVPAGTFIRSTRENKTSTRAQVVTVECFTQEYLGTDYQERRPPTILWAGSGGYWRWCDATNCEVAE